MRRLPPAEVIEVVGPVLRASPLTPIGAYADKTSRGCVLVVGGSRTTPGGVLLAGTAALRVGAGRAVLATAASVASALAIAMPETRVIGLEETDDGSLQPRTPVVLRDALRRADAVLLGSGALDAAATGALVRDVLPYVEQAVVIFDAAALPILVEAPELLEPLRNRAVAMPNTNEAARMLGCEPDDVDRDPQQALEQLVHTLGIVVALRGIETWIAGPDSATFHDCTGHPALGTPGSGDVLAGALAGLASREEDLVNAVMWAVHLHGTAGAQLASRGRGIGTLAREIADELPAALRSLDA